MIHRYLKNEAKLAVPALVWSINYFTNIDNTGTVYTEAGSPPEKNDRKTRYPEYQFYIRSTNFDNAELFSQKIFDLFNEKMNFVVIENNRTYHVDFIEAMSEPLRLGVDSNNVMEYSINFKVTLREMK
ncbi:phage tail terminator protein [Niallia sp. 03190]|uniref:phage tail terminator protein n=1 Tax=Niallia sp. 03190 TaxID=3458061 RepID=UPI004043B1A4